MSTHSAITEGGEGTSGSSYKHTPRRCPLSRGLLRSGSLTFARAGVIQVEPVSFLGALQLAFGGKEFAGCVVRLVVCPTNLQQQEFSTTATEFRVVPAEASSRLRTYMIVLIHARRALSRLLAHTPGLVVRVEFAHLATFAGKVVTRICRGK